MAKRSNYYRVGEGGDPVARCNKPTSNEDEVVDQRGKGVRGEAVEAVEEPTKAERPSEEDALNEEDSTEENCGFHSYRVKASHDNLHEPRHDEGEDEGEDSENGGEPADNLVCNLSPLFIIFWVFSKVLSEDWDEGATDSPQDEDVEDEVWDPETRVVDI